MHIKQAFGLMTYPVSATKQSATNPLTHKV